MHLLPKNAWSRTCLALSLGAAVAYVLFIHNFLAVTRPVGGEVLIVESWFPDAPAMREAATRFLRGTFKLAICVGGPADEAGAQSDPALARDRLVQFGVDPAAVQVVVVSEPEGLRTLGSALAVRNWLAKERPHLRSVDVFTLGVHARKSWVLFRKAFGSSYRVGIIAGRDSAYPDYRWWGTRTGWYLVLRNTIGYLYALSLRAPSNAIFFTRF